MPEIIVGTIVLGLLLSPQLLAGFLAKRTGRNFWFWFFISFLIPLISLIVLIFLEDKNPATSGYKLADHVDREKGLVSEAVK
ncbi:MFS family permease [Flavobacterium sp. W4I14]|nr:MFS family permease [Flavobacterium sp. W4I14]